MWNLKIWYKWNYLQNRNRLTELKKKEFMIAGGKDELRREIDWELGIDMYTLLSLK